MIGNQRIFRVQSRTSERTLESTSCSYKQDVCQRGRYARHSVLACSKASAGGPRAFQHKVGSSGTCGSVLSKCTSRFIGLSRSDRKATVFAGLGKQLLFENDDDDDEDFGEHEDDEDEDEESFDKDEDEDEESFDEDEDEDGYEDPDEYENEAGYNNDVEDILRQSSLDNLLHDITRRVNRSLLTNYDTEELQELFREGKKVAEDDAALRAADPAAADIYDTIEQLRTLYGSKNAEEILGDKHKLHRKIVWRLLPLFGGADANADVLNAMYDEHVAAHMTDDEASLTEREVALAKKKQHRDWTRQYRINFNISQVDKSYVPLSERPRYIQLFQVENPEDFTDLESNPLEQQMLLREKSKKSHDGSRKALREKVLQSKTNDLITKPEYRNEIESAFRFAEGPSLTPPLHPMEAWEKELMNRLKRSVEGVVENPLGVNPAATLESFNKLNGWIQENLAPPDQYEDVPDHDHFTIIDPNIFDKVATRVVVGDRGIPTVLLRHPSGSEAKVSLLGAIVTSWKVHNGSEVLYWKSDKEANPDFHIDISQEDETPYTGGIQFHFPQVGLGGPNCLGELPGLAQPLLEDGFASAMMWEVVATDNQYVSVDPYGEKQGMCPFETLVSLRLVDTPETREIYPFNWELRYDVMLGPSTITTRMYVKNKCERKVMPFTARVQGHLGVTDLLDVEEVNVQGCYQQKCYDKAAHDRRLRIRREMQRYRTFDGRMVDRCYFDHDEVAVNVGTGASVLCEALQGYTDVGVFTPGRWLNVFHFRKFVALGAEKLCSVQLLRPGEAWSGLARYQFYDEPLVAKRPDRDEFSRWRMGEELRDNREPMQGEDERPYEQAPEVRDERGFKVVNPEDREENIFQPVAGFDYQDAMGLEDGDDHADGQGTTYDDSVRYDLENAAAAASAEGRGGAMDEAEAAEDDSLPDADADADADADDAGGAMDEAEAAEDDSLPDADADADADDAEDDADADADADADQEF